MKRLFPVLFSLLIFWQTPNSNDDASPLAVTSFKWSRMRRTVETKADVATVPARAMIPQNKNLRSRAARTMDTRHVQGTLRTAWKLATVTSQLY